MLAVHKAGGVYVPLDPGYPGERLGLMVADAGASVVVTSSVLVAGLSGLSAEVVLVDRPGLWAGESAEDVPPVVGPESACYVIYTSGSTGRPKGAVVTHAGLVNRTAHVAPRSTASVPTASSSRRPRSASTSHRQRSTPHCRRGRGSSWPDRADTATPRTSVI